jgi:hypothetical protein
MKVLDEQHTDVGQPPMDSSAAATQALFEEARRLRRRRWIFGLVLFVVVSLVVALLVSLDLGAPWRSAPSRGGLPSWTLPQGKPKAAPALFVAGDGSGGIGAYSTANGALIRTISPQGPGGPDQQAEVSRNRQSVFFTQPTGPCSGNIVKAPVSGSSAPAAVISDSQTLALSPSPSPTSTELAWVGVTCGPTGSTTSSTLYITNLVTGVRSDLGAFSGQHSDDAISWNSDGTQLAVESGTTVAMFDTNQSPPRNVGVLDVTSDCTLTSPTFLSPRNQLAVIRTCYGTPRIPGTSQVLVFNVFTGKSAAIIASAPQGTTFQGLSVDASGQHFLIGVVTDFPQGAHNMQLESGHLVAVGGNAPTDAQW